MKILKQVIYWFTDRHREVRWVREDDTEAGEQRALKKAEGKTSEEKNILIKEFIEKARIK